jgi:hypothetical protein
MTIYAILKIMRNELYQLEKKAEKKAKSRERKKKPRMKVSGKSVFKLQEIARKRGKS